MLEAPEFKTHQPVDFEGICWQQTDAEVEDRATKALLGGLWENNSTAESALGITESNTTTPNIVAYEQVLDRLKGIAVLRTRAAPNATGISFWQDNAAHRFFSQQADIYIETRFNILANFWKRETEYLSRIDDKVSHRAYREIIAMGLPVVPLILKELEKSGGYWFTALSEITHHNPVANQKKCSLKDVALAWIAWGKANANKP